MIKSLKMIALGAIVLASSGSAFASYHTQQERDKTKIAVAAVVKDACAVGAVTKPDCAALTGLVESLYQNPEKATENDVKIVLELAGYSARYAGLLANTRLAALGAEMTRAFDRAETVTFHVVYMHEGQWDKLAMCPQPS